MFGEQQMLALADYIRAALMLNFNERTVGSAPPQSNVHPWAHMQGRLRSWARPWVRVHCRAGRVVYPGCVKPLSCGGEEVDIREYSREYRWSGENISKRI